MRLILHLKFQKHFVIMQLIGFKKLRKFQSYNIFVLYLIVSSEAEKLFLR